MADGGLTGFSKYMLRTASLLVLILVSACSSPQGGTIEWPAYQGDNGRNQYSPLTQINRDNVSRLGVAWTFRTGDMRERSQMQCNPIIVNSVMYASSPQLKILAINAATGELIWKFDPFVLSGKERNPVGLNRGVMYWEDGDDRRILFCADHYLHALDAMTGRLIESFGDSGRVDIKKGLDRDIGDLTVMSHTPGAIYKDLLILGTMVSEGPNAAPGHIRAYDIRTGERKWIFHTIPHPGEFGHDTWPEDAWKTLGGANSWAGMSLDAERGMVFIPTGSTSFDFYGGNREGQNLFANSVIALNAETGERIWHFQTVHHDIWDRDIACPPNLITVTHNGRKIDAVAQVTKGGVVFLFNRETGEALFPIEERPVPASDIPGEVTYPTQPFPLKPFPFARQVFREDDITDISPDAHEFVLERFRGYRSAGQFEPPSFEGTILFPGFDGGAGWGGAAADPEDGILYIKSKEVPCVITILKVDEKESGERTSSAEFGRQVYNANCAACHGDDREGDTQYMYPALRNLNERLERIAAEEIIKDGRGNMPSFEFLSEKERISLLDFLYGIQSRQGIHFGDDRKAEESIRLPYTFTGYNRFRDKDGYPAVKPQWGTLTAIDMNEGVIKWQVPLGEMKELTERGIPQTGAEGYGGPVSTAGGLLFIAATMDEKFRAFDKETGEVLFETSLPAAGYATPATYEVNGRQYVVIACGGGKLGTKSGDYYVAFALPE